MAGIDLDGPIQHPAARIHRLLDELKTFTRGDDSFAKQTINALWNELEDLLVMLSTKDGMDVLLQKAIAYDKLTAMISPLPQPGPTETTDANTDEASRPRDSDRGSDPS